MTGAAAAGFITGSFEAMLKECAGKKYPDLRSAVQDCLYNMKETKASDENKHVAIPAGEERDDGDALAKEGDGLAASTQNNSVTKSQEINEPIIVALANVGHTLDRAQTDLILKPLRLAFESKNKKLLELALDCIHKLIVYDHLEGDPGLEGGKNAALFTDMLNMVCGCVDNSSLDSTIVQVLQALLTAVSSMRFRVHGDPLLGVIRVCYDIALNSKSLVNQATSKAMLTQMISIVFRRMETDQVPVSSSIAHAGTPASNTSSENVEKSSDEKDAKNSVADALPKKQENDSSPSLEEFQNLASGADIKGLEAALDKLFNLRMERKFWDELV